MPRNPMVRIAFVRLSPNGKSYPMKCEREDILVGSEVEVLMHANTDSACYQNGVVTSISYERWNCGSHVLNLECEVEYSADPSTPFERTIDLTKKPLKPLSEL